MLKRRKPPKGCSIAFYVLLLFIILAYVFVYRDVSKMPSDADLRLVYEDIPDEENAFARLMKAAAMIELTPEEESRLKTADRDGFWDAELAEVIVGKNAKALAEYEAALACTRSQAPPVQPLDMDATSPPEPERPGLGELKRLLEQHVLNVHVSGDENAAFGAALDLIRCGDAIKRSKGTTMAFLYGVAMQRDGLECLDRLLGDATLGPDQSTGYIAVLEPFKDDADAWADMYRAEYTAAALTIRDMVGNQVRRIAPGGSEGQPAPVSAQRRAWSLPFLYQPKKTMRALSESYRPLVENTAGPYAVIHGSLPEPTENRGVLIMLLTGNAIGEMLSSIVKPAMEGMPERMCLSRSQVSATQVIIALKCHEINTGALPESLDELVPRYFESVPLDYFDGKPIKYALEKRLVYCVGADLADTGGTEGTDPSWAIP